MTDLKQLADRVDRVILTAGERDYIAALLRAASAETVGMEWDRWDDPNMISHNADIQACRVAIAAAKADAASLRAELLTAHAQAEEMSGKRAAVQAAIDEAVSLYAVDDGAGLGMWNILRPHASPLPTLDAAEPVKPQRQWRREYPVGVRFWLSWFDKKCCQRMTMLAGKRDKDWANRTSLHDETWCLPYVDGDTEDTLPPLPNSPEIPDGSTPKPDDTRELVARLAEYLRSIYYGTGGTASFLDAIIADARRGGGA